MFLDNIAQGRRDFQHMEEVISNEDNIDGKLSAIREMFKILFNFGVLKLSKKKSTLGEINELRKEVGVAPILMLQSRLTSIFNSVYKGMFLIILEETAILAWIKFLNDKWISHEVGNEKLIKIVDYVSELIHNNKPSDKIRTYFLNELTKSGIKLENPEGLLTQLKERVDLVKSFTKKLPGLIGLNNNGLKSSGSNKDKLPKINGGKAQMVSAKSINNFLHSASLLEDKENNVTSPKHFSEKAQINSHRGPSNGRDSVTSITNFLSNNTNKSNGLMHDLHSDKKVELKSQNSNAHQVAADNFKRSESRKGTTTTTKTTKITINDTATVNSNNFSRRGSAEISSNGHPLILAKSNYSSHDPPQSLGLKKMKSNEIKINLKIDNPHTKSINITSKRPNPIKDLLIHDKLDYKPSI